MKKNKKFINKEGATLLEFLISIFLILFIIIVLTASFRAIILNREIKTKAQAHSLALEEMEVIRKTSFTDLTNRTNADFLGVSYNLGQSRTKSDNQASSSPHVYELLPASSPKNNLTSLAFIPGNAYEDFTFKTMIKILNTSPSGWQAGLVFRYKDINNHYRFIFNSSLIKLEKIINGTSSNIFSTNQNFNFDTWYKLKVTTNWTFINLYLNDNLLSTITDESSNKGTIGLAGLNSGKIYFDDVDLITSSTTSWNFDSDPAGSTASGWERFGINDLPGGQGKLTIEDYNGSTDLKKIIVEVSWLQDQKTKNVRLVNLVGQYGFNL